MKKNFLLFALSLSCINIFAQNTEDKADFIEYTNEFYREIKKGISEYNSQGKVSKKTFKMDFSNKNIPKSTDEFTTVWCHSPISQGRTGTCWCFSTSSYFESEVFRLTKQKVKLSELYVVYWEYVEKAREYVRTRGKSFFGEGSETNAVSRMMAKYGAMPWDVYNGMRDGQEFHDHKEMFNEMKKYLESLKRNSAWNEDIALETIKTIMDHYIGTPPQSFGYDGKQISPLSYLQDELKLDMNNYINFMSLMEKPFFSKEEYDVPDNWWNSDDYNNIPLEDFIKILKNGVKNGYSISIGGDVSESGYSPTHDVAMIPSYDIPSEYINDYARQLRFTNGSTTDDHAIHVVGYKEEKDDFWFLIKDSGSGARNGKNEGFYFYHEDYVKLKTMTFTIHKDAAKDILKKIQ